MRWGHTYVQRGPLSLRGASWHITLLGTKWSGSLRAASLMTTWVEEKSAVALANYVPHISEEAAHIARLRAHCLMCWLDSSSLSEEEEQEEEEEHKEIEEQEEAGPKPPSTDVELEQGEAEEGPEPSRRQRSQECLAFDDPQSDSDTTADGRSPRQVTPHEPGSPMEAAVEVHTRELEVEEL